MKKYKLVENQIWKEMSSFYKGHMPNAYSKHYV